MAGELRECTNTYASAHTCTRARTRALTRAHAHSRVHAHTHAQTGLASLFKLFCFGTFATQIQKLNRFRYAFK